MALRKTDSLPISGNNYPIYNPQCFEDRPYKYLWEDIFHDNDLLMGVVGEFNENLKELERITGSSLYSRGNSILIKSNPQKNEIIKNAIENYEPINNRSQIITKDGLKIIFGCL